MNKRLKLHKEYCEISECAIKDPLLLHHHHIVERTELGTSNSPWNLAVLCTHHHLQVHHGDIKIIGVFPSTGPHGRTLIYEINGKSNVDGITESYFKPKLPQSRIYEKEKK